MANAAPRRLGTVPFQAFATTGVGGVSRSLDLLAHKEGGISLDTALDLPESDEYQT